MCQCKMVDVMHINDLRLNSESNNVQLDRLFGEIIECRCNT